MSTKDIRKTLNILKESEIKTVDALVEDFNDDIDDPSEPNTKVEIEFTGPDKAEVEVFATGMDEVKRLVDLAGIFHSEKAGSMGVDVMDPVADTTMPSGEVGFEPEVPAVTAEPGMDIDSMGIDDPMDVDMGVDPMDSPIDEPMDAGMDMDMADDPMDTGMEPPMDAPMDMGADDIGPKPTGMISPASDMRSGMNAISGIGDDSMGMDLPTGGPDVPAGDMDMASMDDMEVGFSTEPEVEGIGERFDYGNPNANLGQEEFHMDAYNFAGGASKPVRAIPARSGDNPMVTPAEKKGLKEYMADLVEELEKKELTEAPDPETELRLRKVQSAFKDNTPNASVRASVDDEVFDMEKDPQLRNLSSLEMQARIEDNLKDQGTKMTDPNKDDLDDEVEDMDEGKRNYSFKQSVLPFQGLTASQRLSRNALRTTKRAFRKK